MSTENSRKRKLHIVVEAFKRSRQVSPPSRELPYSAPGDPSSQSDAHLPSIPPVAEPTRQLGPANLGEIVTRRRILDAALQLLNKKDRERIGKASSNDPDVAQVIDVVRSKCIEKQILYQKKNWTFNFRGRTIKLRDEAEKAVKWLDRFKAAGDIAVNADPIHAGLPWMGIRILLEATTSDIREMAALMIGIENALYFLKRLDIYLHYICEPQQTEKDELLEGSLAKLYALILHFFAEAIRIYQNSLAKRSFYSFWKINDIVDFEKDAEKLAGRIEIDAQTRHRQINDALMKNILHQLEQTREPRGLGDTIDEIWINLQEIERANILSWISQIPFADNHEMSRQGRTKGTAEWIFQRSEYQTWESSPQSSTFWLHGIPGAGKTKLTASVIDRMLGRSNIGAFAYFYCNRNEEPRRDSLNVLRSFVKQLSVSKNNTSLRESVVAAYREKKRLDGSTGFTYGEAERLLSRLVQENLVTVLILDAMDECTIVHRQALIDTFGRLIQHLPKLKIFIASRRDDDIKRELEKEANIGIDATDNQRDIARYVDEAVEVGQLRRRSPISGALKKQIVQTVLQKSQGMFQWAYLQTRSVLALDREADIRDYLERLPKDLVESYHEIWKEIESQEGSKPEIAKRAFQWIVTSVEPLGPEALVAAVCQDVKKGFPQLPDIDIYTVLSACKNLVEVVQAEGKRRYLSICQFSHLSVREYLESHHEELVHTSTEMIAKVYLSLISLPDCWTTLNDQPSGLRTLWMIAGLFYPDQLRLFSRTIPAEILSLLKRFLIHNGTTSDLYKSWLDWVEDIAGSGDLQFTFSFYSGCLVERFIYPLSESQSLPFPICAFGWNELWEDSIKSGFNNVDETTKSEFGELSLLQMAILGGHHKTVETLLANGACANMQVANRFASALATASSNAAKRIYDCDLEIVQLLLENGAEANMHLTKGDYSSALEVAAEAESNNEQIIRMLLKYGADANVRAKGLYGSALAAAAFRGNQRAVQLLLENGADANLQIEGKYGSALAAAAKAGHRGTVRLLLENRADVNMRLGGHYGSALAAASKGSDGELLQMLLENGADVNMLLGGKYGTALLAAAKKGRSHIVGMLLENGANANLRPEGDFRSALEVAVSNSYGWFRRTISLLMAHGAEMDEVLWKRIRKDLDPKWDSSDTSPSP